MKYNKWIINISTKYKVGEETFFKTEGTAIPRTSGDRIDVIGTSGKYYYNMSREKFYDKVSKEEWLEETTKIKNKEEKEKALKSIDWTPRKIKDEVAIIIHIKKGEITLSDKF